MPAFTLGCGAVGGSATSENVGPMQLLDRRYIAVGKLEIEDIRAMAAKEASECGAATTCTPLGGGSMNGASEADIDLIVKKILEKLSA